MTDSNADHIPADHQARVRALDPETSFIVQAPAGSGKTGLLTQRFLRLLATVDAPEEIVAITFTRKAAGEMRDRIISALNDARNGSQPASSYEQQTLALAETALQRDRALDWNLLANPSRLRILTIDALCQTLVRQTPLLSRLGAMPGITEDAGTHYEQAAQAVLDELDDDSELSASIARLLHHRDNRMAELKSLIAAMLGRRDQWLRHVAPHALHEGDPLARRAHIEGMLVHLVEEALTKIEERLTVVLTDQLPGLLGFAVEHAPETSLLRQCGDWSGLPGTCCEDLPRWQAIADLLLTRDGQWRKSVNKNLGFPAAGSGGSPEQKSLFTERKQSMQSLLESLRDQGDLQDLLIRVRQLPAPAYSNEEWQLLDDLFQVLMRAVQHLQLVFAQHGETDFIGMALAADQALGEEDAPTDLCLRLDYQIRHLLVDEFQDTSQNQFSLFRKLLAGWEQGDARTLFLVGDPMQSIYRFREADVGLFLQAWEGALGQVALEPLTLSVNFRSQQGIIDWVNMAFPQILPAESDKVHGAVAYTQFEANQPLLDGEAVSIHARLDTDRESEAEQVIDIVRQSKEEDPNGSIAILLRSRAHAGEIIRQLKQHEISYQAVEIDGLSRRPVVRDLLALSRALLHMADRISWLAILRAPWCGLALSDLHAIAALDRMAPIADILQGWQGISALSSDARERLQRVWPILEQTLAQRGRQPLREWVEGAWLALGGPACLRSDTENEDVEVFLQLLDRLDADDEPVSLELLQEQVERLFALPDVNADGTLQIMTMHKAKGLEFDTVILPGLERRPRADESRLLYWLERTGRTGGSEIIFGPIQSAREKTNRTAEYIKQLDREMGRYESGRLLYVAATRAKKRLHLLGEVSTGPDHDAITPPATTSLLNLFWPVVSDYFDRRLGMPAEPLANAEQQVVQGSPPAIVLRRLVSGWSCPEPPLAVIKGRQQEAEREFELEFDWASETARMVGISVHRILQRIAEKEMTSLSHDDWRHFERIGRSMLMGQGVPGGELEAAVERIMSALRSTLDDDRGRWILSPGHEDARNEYALTTRMDGRFIRLVIDRTFIDQDGIRWVIDYKTGSHGGGGLEEFLDREQERYREQLERYARVMKVMEERPVRMGLYFPLLRGWREWHLPD